MNSFIKGVTNRYTRVTGRVYMSNNFKSNCYVVQTVNGPEERRGGGGGGRQVGEGTKS